MTHTLARTGLLIPEADDSDTVDVVRDILAITGFLEASGLIYAGKGLRSARPVSGKQGRVYQSTDEPGTLDYDDGTDWVVIGRAAPTDPSAGTPGLRTLGSGATQAASGIHTHPEKRLITKLNTAGQKLIGPFGLTTASTGFVADGTWGTIIASGGSEPEYALVGVGWQFDPAAPLDSSCAGVLIDIGQNPTVLASVVDGDTGTVAAHKMGGYVSFDVPVRLAAGNHLEGRIGFINSLVSTTYTASVYLAVVPWVNIEGN